MNKSNIPDIIMWGVYAVITGVCLVATAVAFSNSVGYGIGFGVVCAVLGTALIGVFARGVHKLVQKIQLNTFFEKRKFLRLVVEGFTLLGILVGMVFVRLPYSWNVTGYDVYEIAQIKTVETEVVSGHGGYDLYLCLVKLSLFLLGNRVYAPMALQLVLLMCAAVAMYFGVRRLAGSVSALVVVGVLGFAPYMVVQTCNLTSFLVVLFFFGVALICIGGISHGISQCDTLPDQIAALFCYMTSGLLIGLCCYLDVSGIVLLVIMTGVICSGDNLCCEDAKRDALHDKYKSGKLRELEISLARILGNPAIVFISIVLLAVFMFWLIHGDLDSITRQLALYVPGGFRVPVTVNESDSLAEGLVIVAFLVFGAFSFWFQRRMGTRKVWLFVVILLAGMQCFGIMAVEYFDGYALLYLMCLILAGCGITDVFLEKPQMEEVVREDFDMAIIDMDAPEKVSENQEAVQEIEFIENPLPLPKKHVKKVMDYDIEVADDDDFDI